MHLFVRVLVYMHVHVCCCFCLYDHLPGCDSSDSGGCARKSVALSLILSPMKRVQSSPNLATGTNTHKHTTNEHMFKQIKYKPLQLLAGLNCWTKLQVSLWKVTPVWFWAHLKYKQAVAASVCFINVSSLYISFILFFFLLSLFMNQSKSNHM